MCSWRHRKERPRGQGDGFRRGKEEGFGREHKGREEKIKQQKVDALKSGEGKQKQRVKKHAEAVIEREFLIR